MRVKKILFPLLTLFFFSVVYTLAVVIHLPSIPQLGGGEAEITSPTAVTGIHWNVSYYGGLPKVDGVWITCADLLPSGAEFYVYLLDNSNAVIASGTKILDSDLPASTPTLVPTAPPALPSIVYKISVVISASTAPVEVVFSASGLGSDAVGTVLTVDGTSYSYSDLPKTFAWAVGSSHSFSWASQVNAGENKRYTWENATGLSTQLSDTITVPGGGGSIVANYGTQWRVTFAQTGLDSSATGTVVNVNGTEKGFSDLPYVFWADNGTIINFDYSPVVSSSTPNKRFNLTGVSGGSSPITVASAVVVTGNYAVQWNVTFTQASLDSSASGTVVTVDGTNIAYGSLPYSKWVNNGAAVTYSYSSTVSSSTSGKRFALSGVSGPASPITVTSPVTVTGNYGVQWNVTFAQTGLDSSANGTVVTVNGVAKTYADLPYSFWANNGAQVTYTYSSIVSSSTSGKRFSLSGVSGPTSPITVTSAVTVTGNFATQWLVTFAQTGLDSSASGTVVTVNGAAKTYADLPYSFWVNNGTQVTYSYSDPVSSSTDGKRFALSSVSGPASPITVTSAVTVIGNYVVQYRLVITINAYGGDGFGTTNPSPGTYWYNAGSSVQVTASAGHRSYFDRWYLDGSYAGTANPITVTMNAPHTLDAEFIFVEPS